MKRFAICAALLPVLVAGARAQENAPMQTMKVTTGKVVTSIQVPEQLGQGKFKPRFSSTNITMNDAKHQFTLTGNCLFQPIGTVKIKADRMSVDTSRNFSATLQGHVSIEVQENGQKSVQLLAESATVDFQKLN